MWERAAYDSSGKAHAVQVFARMLTLTTTRWSHGPLVSFADAEKLSAEIVDRS